ncbi:hypothetical protein L9F63_025105, partial [Diploptera punctata]
MNKRHLKVNKVIVKSNENIVDDETSTEVTFYIDVRLMLIFSKFFGVFTLQNINENNGHNLKHKLICFDTMWGFVFTGILPIAFIDREVSKFTFYFACLQCVRGITFSVLSTFYDKHLPLLFKKTEHVEKVISCIIGKNKCKKTILRSNKIFMYLIYFGSILFVVIGSIIQQHKKGHDLLRITQNSLLVLNIIPRQLCIVLYIYICQNLIHLFTHVKNCWKITSQKIIKLEGNYERELDGELEKLRLLHSDLTKAGGILNSAYGTRLAFYLATVFVEILADLY